MARGKGTGKPCGATHIASNRVCKIKVMPGVAKALKSAAAELKTSIKFTVG